jgi:hypothetical protein
MLQQTRDIGAIFQQAATANGTQGEPLGAGLRSTARIQAALCLALGVELQFFDGDAAHRLLADLHLDPGADLALAHLQSNPFVSDRIHQIGDNGLGTPAYRPAFAVSDGALIAFRSVLIPIVCGWQKPAEVPSLLARVMAREADDFDPVATTAILEYLEVATRAIDHAGDWRQDTEAESDEGWLRGELATLFQVQVDTAQPAVRQILSSMAERLANAAFGELQEMILASISDEDEQANLLVQLTTRTDSWRAEAVDIVDRYDSALRVPVIW